MTSRFALLAAALFAFSVPAAAQSHEVSDLIPRLTFPEPTPVPAPSPEIVSQDKQSV